MIRFHTSNIEKFLHLRTLFDRHGIVLQYFESHTEPYPEDYSGTKEDLLRKSWQAVQKIVGGDWLFIIEDTSIRIDALSSVDVDVPGMSAKEWFESTSFVQVDEFLRSKGNDRGCVVRSDIALNVPGLGHPAFFSGSTKGRVADKAPAFQGQRIYPWLTPNTFNGWFVPEGASRPLGAMTFEESLPYDFRAKAVGDLIDRLEEYHCIVNLPPQSSLIKARGTASSSQLALWDTAPATRSAFIVVGMVCAGKTTFAEYAEQRHDFAFIEASGIVRSLWVNEETDESLREFSKRLCDESGADFVSRQILEHFGEKLEGSFVISGFRLLEEIEVLKEVIPEAKVILIEAPERVRYARHIARHPARSGEGKAESFEDFTKGDEFQRQFGLLRVAGDIADVIVSNDGELDEYWAQIEAVLTGTDDIRGVRFRAHPDLTRNELYRCLSCLAVAQRPLDCAQIESATTVAGGRIRHNNVNKALKAVPELAQRLERGKRIRYQITPVGQSYLRLLERKG